MKLQTFNLRDLTLEVAEQFGLSKRQSSVLTRYMFDRISQELDRGKQVRLHKFGTLTVRDRAQSVARNPRTGETVPLPARRVVRLVTSPILKHRINRNGT